MQSLDVALQPGSSNDSTVYIEGGSSKVETYLGQNTSVNERNKTS